MHAAGRQTRDRVVRVYRCTTTTRRPANARSSSTADVEATPTDTTRSKHASRRAPPENVETSSNAIADGWHRRLIVTYHIYILFSPATIQLPYSSESRMIGKSEFDLLT